MVTCVTETAALSLKRSCQQRGDNKQLEVDLAGKDWSEIISFKPKYHRSCYRSFIKGNKESNKPESTLLRVLFHRVREVILVNNETLSTCHLQKMYNELSRLSIAKKLFRSKPLVDLVLEEFDGQLALYKPPHSIPFIFNNTLSKGEIFHVLTNALKMSDKILYL